MPITVILAEREHLVLQGALRALEAASDISVVATTDSGTTLIELIREHVPTVTVASIQLNALSGLDVLERVTDVAPMLFLATDDKKEHIYRAMTLGARGYLLRWDQRITLESAVRQVASGNIVISEGAIKGLVAAVREHRTAEVHDLTLGLSPREKDILRLTANGLTQAKMATELGLSLSTIKTYCRSAYTKLGVTRGPAAVREAMRLGLIQAMPPSQTEAPRTSPRGHSARERHS